MRHRRIAQWSAGWSTRRAVIANQVMNPHRSGGYDGPAEVSRVGCSGGGRMAERFRRATLGMTVALCWCALLPAVAGADGSVAYQGDSAHSGLVAGTLAPPLTRGW